MSDDFAELIQLERDLTQVAHLIPHKAGQAVQQAAMATKKRWKNDARGNKLKGQYTATIDYETRNYGAFGQGVYEAEIGPNLAYGGNTGRGGLVPSAGIFDDPMSPVDRPPDRARQKAEKFAAEDLDRGIEKAVEQSLAEANFYGSFGAGVAAVVKGGIYG